MLVNRPYLTKQRTNQYRSTACLWTHNWAFQTSRTNISQDNAREAKPMIKIQTTLERDKLGDRTPDSHNEGVWKGIKLIMTCISRSP